MIKVTKKDIWLLLIQLAVWAVIILLPPLAGGLTNRQWQMAQTMLFFLWGAVRSPFYLYFLNFYIYGPFLFFKRRIWAFVLVNLATIACLNSRWFFINHTHHNPNMKLPDAAWAGLYTSLITYFLLNCVVIAVAIAIRQFINMRKLRQQLEETRLKNTEAELAWLKNQINPHFLFNTLNNISSLTQIDADAAQDSIAQLSELLRYAIYETNKEKVPVKGEVNFMSNYIDLMKLRCNDKTDVRTYFNVPQNFEIAPLLFISLVENAFKHGVSSNRESYIDISLFEEGNKLIFACENTNFSKNDTDRSGSGIGLENTRRRLDLIYADHYTWEQSGDDNKFFIKITLQLDK